MNYLRERNISTAAAASASFAFMAAFISFASSSWAAVLTCISLMMHSKRLSSLDMLRLSCFASSRISAIRYQEHAAKSNRLDRCRRRRSLHLLSARCS